MRDLIESQINEKINKKKEEAQTNYEYLLDELRWTQQIVIVIRRPRVSQ